MDIEDGEVQSPAIRSTTYISTGFADIEAQVISMLGTNDLEVRSVFTKTGRLPSGSEERYMFTRQHYDAIADHVYNTSGLTLEDRRRLSKWLGPLFVDNNAQFSYYAFELRCMYGRKS